jgi:hypothetical protein
MSLGSRISKGLKPIFELEVQGTGKRDKDPAHRKEAQKTYWWGALSKVQKMWYLRVARKVDDAVSHCCAQTCTGESVNCEHSRFGSSVISRAYAWRVIGSRDWRVYRRSSRECLLRQAQVKCWLAAVSKNCTKSIVLLVLQKLPNNLKKDIFS